MPDFVFRAADFTDAEYQTTLRQFLNGLVVGDWRQAMVARGFGWNMVVGALITPIVGGGAGTTIAIRKPEAIVSVPSGYTMVPLRVSVNCKMPLLAADSDISEILLAVDSTAVWAGDGTVTTETPLNLRTDLATTCPLTCASAATANITQPTHGLELARAAKTGDVQGTAANAMWNDLSLLYEPQNPPFIVGPAAMYLHWGGTVATSGYAQLNFLAFASSLVTNLV